MRRNEEKMLHKKKKCDGAPLGCPSSATILIKCTLGCKFKWRPSAAGARASFIKMRPCPLGTFQSSSAVLARSLKQRKLYFPRASTGGRYGPCFDSPASSTRHHFLELTLLLTSEAQLRGKTRLLTGVCVCVCVFYSAGSLSPDASGAHILCRVCCEAINRRRHAQG